MVVLKKVKAATLVETLVASVLIIIVFLIASMSLNNVFKGMVKTNDHAFQHKIKELTYFTLNETLSLPFYEENASWEISIDNKENKLVLSALNRRNAETTEIILNEDP